MAAFVVRTNTDGLQLFVKLQSGSARIGWSYRDGLDLQNILEENTHGRFQELDVEQQDAWRCHGFIDVANDGDYLFYPNVPEYGLFCVVKLAGPYKFLESNEGIAGDFRSSRPCELVTPEPIRKLDAIVPAVIRHKLGFQRRFYQLKVDPQDIDLILNNLQNRGAAGTTHSHSFSRMIDDAHRDLARRWPSFFPRANLSRFLADLLEKHGERVDLREGRSDEGTDLVVEIQNDFLDRPLVIGIQVGSYHGDVLPCTVTRKLNQLLSGWDRNCLDYGALVLTGDWNKDSIHVVEEHNRRCPSRRVKWIDGHQLARIVTRTTWIKDT